MRNCPNCSKGTISRTCERSGLFFDILIRSVHQRIWRMSPLRSLLSAKNSSPLFFLQCNKMTCPNCSTVSCYICRKVITGYEHFNQSGRSSDKGKCILWDKDLEAMHATEVRPSFFPPSHSRSSLNAPPPHCALTTRSRKPPKKLSRKLNHSTPTCPTPISKSISPSRSNLFLQCHVYLSITYFIAWLPIIFPLSHKYRRLRRQGARSYNTVVVVEIRHQSERDFFATYYINPNLLLQTLRINTMLTLFNMLLIISLIKIRRCRLNLCALITKL